MKKTASLVGLAILVIGGIWWALKPGVDLSTPEQIESPTAVASDQVGPGVAATPKDKTIESAFGAEAKPIPEKLHERVQIMNARRPGRNFTAEEVERAMARHNMWSTGESIATEKIPLEEEQIHDGRQLIQFSPIKLESLQTGDRVMIDIVDANTTYEVEIDRIQKHDYDSISWYGHIDGNDGQRYQVSFTRGDMLTVGGIDTPAGNYQLQAHGNAGWIASSGSLFETSEETDAVYPPKESSETP